MESSAWLQGPEWIRQDSEFWPTDELTDITETPYRINLFVELKENRSNLKQILSLKKYSNCDKMFRVTAYVRRFLNNVKKENKLTGILTVKEINEAEIYWIRCIQEEELKEEISKLEQTKVLNTNSSILTLSPFLDENKVLRLGGRLEEADLPYEVRHPAILPKQSTFTNLIILKAHQSTSHSGVNATLATVRKRYWIIQGRQRIKSLIGKCVKCKRLKGKPGNEPFAPLPRNRLTMANPFKITGIDFAGPLYAYDSGNTSEYYILLLTCAVVRAVHLELVPDLTAESCIRGIRRFIARRGVPSVIYSDNAKTFKRTSRELQELSKILTNKEVQEFASKHYIQWNFIVERASWWGGFWERLVRTIKSALKLTLGRASIHYDELQTVLAEVEATVNSRPLTYIDDDPSNLTVLSPSKFLIGYNDVGMTIDTKLPIIQRNDILNQWRIREQVVLKFWNRWCVDYLQQLRSAHHTEATKSSKFKIGDIALVHDEKQPRLIWKMARITSVYQGRDKRIRACEVQVSNGDRLRRPVQLLYPLEIDQFPPGEDVENTAVKKEDEYGPDRPT